jgi:type I restriction enzyme S subunit
MNRGVPVKFLYRVIDERGGEGSGLPLMSVSLTRGVVPRSDISESEGRADSLSNYKVCRPGDIVINRMSAYQGALGLSRQKGLVSPDYLVLRPNEDVSASYLSYMFKSRWFVGEMTRRLRGIGSTEQGNVRTPRINSDDLGLISIKLPTLKGQQIIAEYLDRETARIDELIKKKRQMVSLLNERWKVELSLTLDLVTGPTAHLSHIARISSGTGFPIDQQGNEDETIQFFKVGDLASSPDGVFLDRAPNTISSTTARVLGCRLAPAGSVIFPKVGAALLGNQRRIVRRASAFDNNLMAVTSQVLEPRYLRFVLTQFDFGELANPGPVPSINEDVVGSLRMKVPTLDEQQRIVKRLENRMSTQRMLVSKYLKVVDFLTERRQALITAAVTGELEIPEVAA